MVVLQFGCYKFKSVKSWCTRGPVSVRYVYVRTFKKIYEFLCDKNEAA
jgi:hypothetical protein